jgi:UDP-N-acetylglucosamine 1-carboxyvinyltransferase
MELKKRLGALVRDRRQLLNLSQEELGLRIGSDQAYVSRIEGGHMNLTIDTIEALAAALDIEASELLVEKQS